VFRRTISALVVTLILTSILPSAFNIQPIKTESPIVTVPEESAAMQGTRSLASQEPPPTEWNKTYGGMGDDEALSMVRSSDGGYALAGYANSSGAGDYDFWLVRTDSAGNALWNRTYGGTNTDQAYDLVQTVDGGYALAGVTLSFGFGAGKGDFWLVKTDASGNAQWNKTYGGTGRDGAYGGLVQTADGGYALAGYTNSFGAGSYDFWLVKTDASGTMQWNKTYGGTHEDVAYSLVQTADGGYALAGDTYSFGAGDCNSWLVKTGASGNAQWNKTYGGTNHDEVLALVQTGDGGYALAGYTDSFGAGFYDFWLVKTGASGNAQWNKTYGGTDYDEALALVQTEDGGYALAGLTSSFGAGSYDFWLVKTDASGNAQWNQTYGGTGGDYANALVQTLDGGYALAGLTDSCGAGSYDFWLVKTGPRTAPKFKMDDWVQTTANINVREGPGLGYTIIRTMPLGTIGQVIGGPAEADGFVWWNVSYNAGVTGWSAENWLELHVDEEPTCVVGLQQNGVKISEVGVWEFFDIYVGDSTGITGIKQVRFSSDNVRDGYPTGEWTDWFDWAISSKDWNATTKIKRWAFDTPGYKEVWAEVKDAIDQTAFGLATIFVPAPALPVLTSPLIITPVKDIYNVGDSLEAKFTIKNIGGVPITLDVLTVGGRLNGFIPPEGAPDFTFQAITLQPNEPYQYQGSLTLTQTGNYRFFVAYYIKNPTSDEERLLGENKWNTCVELGEGLTHTDRVRNIVVYEEGTIPEEVSQLSQRINLWINRKKQLPAYLIDPKVSWAGSVWITVSSVWTDAQEEYDESWQAGVDHDVISQIEAIYARSSLDRGDINRAREHLQSSLLHYKVSNRYFCAAAQVYDRNMEEAIVTVKEALSWITLGLTLANPAAGKFASYVFMIPKFIAEVELVGEDQATIKAIFELTFKFLFSEIENPELGGRTLQNYLNNKVGKLTFPVLQGIFANNEALQFHLSQALKRIVTWETGWLSNKILNELSKQFQSDTYTEFSPVELRVYDSEGKTTGVMNGSVRHEISRSFYRNGTITIFFPPDSHTCEVLGKEEGTYGLNWTHVEDGNITCFTATGIPTSPNATHQYTVDWNALSVSEEGVTVLVDAEGDGVVDRILSSDSKLTGEEFIEKTSPTYPTYALTIIASEGGTTAYPPPGTYACSANSTAQVTATPDKGYVLDYWELDSVNVGSSNPCTVLMQGNHTLNASFRLGIYDIAVTNVSSSKTVVGQGYSLNVSVTVANPGDFTETFVIVYANDTVIGLRTVTLTNGTTAVLTFAWNTTDNVKGNYTISAYAEPLPLEINIADNNQTGGIVYVGIPGDVNGDAKVDVKDVYKVALAYGTSLEGPNPPGRIYNPNCDIDSNGKVDAKDYYIVCKHYGETTP